LGVPVSNNIFMAYKVTIGMEVHAELKTLSKMFCGCRNGLGLETEPNIHICPVCTAQPGALPVPNRAAITSVQRVGTALGCALAEVSRFDRKNYFYPDLPKGYQISQNDEPFCGKGAIEINGKTFGITRIHLEEDTGKSNHAKGSGATLIDLNRAGVPLMELVTEPDFETAEDTKAFCQRLQQILRYLEVSDADMEKGQMRCEVNLSLYKEGEDRLSGTKVEVKNINSFRAVERAVLYEIERQTKILDEGGTLVQETRGWDENSGTTVSQRKKESAHDYRYFPEPDIPPFIFTPAELEALRHTLPELPQDKEKRFAEEYALPVADAVLLCEDRVVAEFYEETVSELLAKINSGEVNLPKERVAKLAANYLLTELRKYMGDAGITDIRQIGFTAENYAELIGLVAAGAINSSAAQAVLAEMYTGIDSDPSHIVERLGLAQVNDSSALEGIVASVLAANEQSVVDYKAGKENAMKFLMGQVMKESKGSANPQMVMEILKQKLA
jgi:aspartyl-tRNA(Asn)/glutamyl-tRNA(Gln) amidotransferase subunit B